MWGFSRPSRLINFDETLTVSRQGSQLGVDISFIDGKPVALHDPVQFTVICTIQPLTGRDLILLPEGDRYKEQLYMWVDDKNSEDKVKLNDIIVRPPGNYQAQAVEQWGSYSRVRLMRVDIGPLSTRLDEPTPPFPLPVP